MPLPARDEARAAFVARALGDARIEPLAGDASFRRYFRVFHAGESLVLVDAPPEKEDLGRFLEVRAALEDAGVRVPRLEAADERAGLALLEDFGDRTWAAALADGADPEPLVADAWAQWLRMQSAAIPGLAAFDAARMHAELDLYLDWYLPFVAGHRPDEDERAGFHAALAPLVEALAALPRATTHLDYHSRNLMVPPAGLPLGVLDFQDACLAHAPYDAASLLYDCYQDYPETLRARWSEALFDMLPAAMRRAFGSAGAWHRAVRLAALQRHLKAIGIFARLAHRDGKRRFLDEIPLTRRHLLDGLDALGGEAPRDPLLRRAPEAA